MTGLRCQFVNLWDCHGHFWYPRNDILDLSFNILNLRFEIIFMYLSKLQKFILIDCYLSKKKKYPRQGLVRFYENYKKPPKSEDQQRIITQSIERLIDKGLLVGFGEKTQHKLFIKKIKLTTQARKQTKKLLGEQKKLPFKIKYNNLKK